LPKQSPQSVASSYRASPAERVFRRRHSRTQSEVEPGGPRHRALSPSTQDPTQSSEGFRAWLVRLHVFDGRPVGPTVAAWSFRSGRPFGAIAGGGHWPRLTPANAISCQHAGAWTQVQAEGGNVSTTSAWNSPSRPPRESPRRAFSIVEEIHPLDRPLHIHHSHDELLHPEGKHVLTIGGAEIRAGPGDLVFGPRECPMHTGAWSRTLVASLKCSRQPASRPFSETLAGTNRNG
jgi:hypothetical protein